MTAASGNQIVWHFFMEDFTWFSLNISHLESSYQVYGGGGSSISVPVSLTGVWTSFWGSHIVLGFSPACTSCSSLTELTSDSIPAKLPTLDSARWLGPSKHCFDSHGLPASTCATPGTNHTTCEKLPSGSINSQINCKCNFLQEGFWQMEMAFCPFVSLRLLLWICYCRRDLFWLLFSLRELKNKCQNETQEVAMGGWNKSSNYQI